MKSNRTLGLLLVAAATVASGAAIAAVTTTSTPGAGTVTTSPPGGKHWRHRGGGMLVGVLLHATRQLNLSSEQQSQIKELLSAARAQHHSSEPALDMTVLGNPADPNYSAAVQTARTRIDTRLQNEVELEGKIYNLLTADQKAKLPQVLADMKAKAASRRAAWEQQHAAPSAAPGTN